jgi:hypothetical protein
MMAIKFDDGGLMQLAVVEIGDAKFQRALAVDDGQHAAAKRGQAGEMRGARGTWISVSIRPRFRRRGGRRTRLRRSKR